MHYNGAVVNFAIKDDGVNYGSRNTNTQIGRAHV